MAAAPGRDHAGAWAAILATVETNAAAVLRDFGIPSNLDSQTHAGAFTLRRSVHMGFRERNFRNGLVRRSRAAGSLTVVVNASVTALRPVAGAPRIESVGCVAAGGTTTVTASRFVICGGAIESTRLLLETERRFDRSPLLGSAALGRCLGDHLSAPIALPGPGERPRVAAGFAPDFASRRMRSWSFVETALPEHSPECFAHWVIDDQAPAFALAREFLGALQAGRMPKLGAREIAASSLDLAGFGWSWLVRRRLRLSPRAAVHLQLDMAQRPRLQNRIALGPGTDRSGRSPALITWSVDGEDIADFAASAARFLDKWGASPQLPGVKRLFGEVSGAKPFSAYHPVGTTPLGAAGENGAVLDQDLQVRGLENVYVASTSALPTAGDANPTFTLLCLTHALSQRLARIFVP
jgi:choline dehydrogenase-like flavoprotein